MAKLKMPLGSLGASGQLGKALVFFPWKGLNCVREWVIPANPKSQAQRDQRDLLKFAVAEYHAALYNALDMTAWARYAGTIKAAMTGFNAMVREHVKEAILTNVWTRIHHVRMGTPAADSFSAFVVADPEGVAPVLYYGTRKTFMPDTYAMEVYGGDEWVGQPAGLTPETLYYFAIQVGTHADTYGRTGIYSVRTIAAE